MTKYLHIHATAECLSMIVVNDEGITIGAVHPVPVPGVIGDSLLEPATAFVGWAKDWDADAPREQYLPVCIGVSDDQDVLIARILKLAGEADR